MKRYINIHINKHLFQDALAASRLEHIKLKELEHAPTIGKCFQFKTKSSCINFINALKSFANDYPELKSHPTGSPWIYMLGNTQGFKIDFSDFGN